MIDFEAHKAKVEERLTVQQQARDLLRGVVGSQRMPRFEAGFQNTLTKVGESPSAYIARVLTTVAEPTDRYQKDASYGQVGVDITNHRLTNVELPHQGIVSIVTYHAGEKVVGHGLTLEGIGAKTVLVDGEGAAQQLDRPLGHLEAVTRAQALFPGQQISRIEAVVVGMLPFDGPEGGQPLPIPLRPRLRQNVA